MLKTNRRWYYIVLILGMFFMTAATGTPADLPVEDYPAVSLVDDLPVPPRGCKTDCMISANINIKPISKGDTSILIGSVLITDENGKPVADAVIVMRWTLPNDTTVVDRVKTDSHGIAVVEVAAMQHGRYVLEVLRGVKDGYHFDHNQGDCDADFWM